MPSGAGSAGAGREGPAPAKGPPRAAGGTTRGRGRGSGGGGQGARPARPAAPGPPGEAARPRSTPRGRGAQKRPRRPLRAGRRPDRRRRGREGGARGCARLGARGNARSAAHSPAREPGTKTPLFRAGPAGAESPWVWCGEGRRQVGRVPGRPRPGAGPSRRPRRALRPRPGGGRLPRPAVSRPGLGRRQGLRAFPSPAPNPEPSALAPGGRGPRRPCWARRTGSDKIAFIWTVNGVPLCPGKGNKTLLERVCCCYRFENRHE